MPAASSPEESVEGAHPAARPLALRLVEEGEMGVHALHPDVRQAPHLPDVVEGVGKRRPEAPEAGVHLDVDGGGPAGRPRRARHRASPRPVVHGRDEVVGEKGRDAFRERAAEHQDGQVDTSAADGERVLEAPGREGEGIAVVGEGARDPSRAVPVGVRLEGGDDLRVRSGEGPKLAQVVAKGREVEFGPVRSDGFQVSPLSSTCGRRGVLAGPGSAGVIRNRIHPTPRLHCRIGRSPGPGPGARESTEGMPRTLSRCGIGSRG